MIATDLMTQNPLMVGLRDYLQLAHEKMEAARFRQFWSETKSRCQCRS